MHVTNLNYVNLKLFFFFLPIEELNDCLILSGEWEILLLQLFCIRMTLNLKFAVIFKQFGLCEHDFQQLH